MTSTPLVEENNISQELEVPDIQDMKTIRIHFNSALNSTRKGLPISANYALVHVSKSISLHQCGFRIINHRLHNIDSTVLCRRVLIKKGLIFKNGGRKMTGTLFGMTQIKSHALTICISGCNYSIPINVCCGFGNRRSRGTTASGPGAASVSSVSTRGRFGCGNLLVALVICPRLISGAPTGCLLGTCAPLTVRAYAVPALELLHLCGGQRTIIVAGRCGLLGLRLNLRLRSGLVSGFAVSCLLSAGF